ncbi:MAG: hypothetical protein IIC51_08215, partial [Planctomycetes bacterium]|nr:hypothetical protein [Planctomycetota bacterium]
DGDSLAGHALLDALIRDIRARQSMVRAVLEDEDEAETLSFVGSKNRSDGIADVTASIRDTLKVSLFDFRARPTSSEAFTILRRGAESAGVFVLLMGNLGSHHTAIDIEFFLGNAETRLAHVNHTGDEKHDQEKG